MRSHLRKRPHQCFQLCSWHAKFKLAAERRADLCRTTAPRRLRCLDVGSNIKAWAEACHIKGGGTPPSCVNESCSSETSTLRFIALFLRLWALTENRNPQKTAALMLYLYGPTFCRGLIWTYGGCGGLRGLRRGEKCEKRLHFSPCVSGLSLLSLSPPTLITHHHSRQILHMCRHASNVCLSGCSLVFFTCPPSSTETRRGRKKPLCCMTVCVFTFPDWSRWKTSCGSSGWTCWLPVKNQGSYQSAAFSWSGTAAPSEASVSFSVCRSHRAVLMVSGVCWASSGCGRECTSSRGFPNAFSKAFRDT